MIGFSWHATTTPGSPDTKPIYIGFQEIEIQFILPSRTSWSLSMFGRLCETSSQITHASCEIQYGP
jgi:hypothetical protein